MNWNTLKLERQIMKIQKVLLGLSLLIVPPAMADPKVEFFSNDSMGCMLLQECTEGINQVKSITDLEKRYPSTDFTLIEDEFNNMMVALNQSGVKVYLSPQKYFPPGHRGVYHTVGNNFFLNDAFVHRPNVLMTVMRHEGWHAAQDCMAGSINNSMIAIIKPEESVPGVWREIVEKTYPKSAVPWEAEAKWAGLTEGMTMKALQACASGEMWNNPDYPPTPLTKEWLIKNGYKVRN